MMLGGGGLLLVAIVGIVFVFSSGDSGPPPGFKEAYGEASDAVSRFVSVNIMAERIGEGDVKEAEDAAKVFDKLVRMTSKLSVPTRDRASLKRLFALGSKLMNDIGDVLAEVGEMGRGMTQLQMQYSKPAKELKDLRQKLKKHPVVKKFGLS